MFDLSFSSNVLFGANGIASVTSGPCLNSGAVIGLGTDARDCLEPECAFERRQGSPRPGVSDDGIRTRSGIGLAHRMQ